MWRSDTGVSVALSLRMGARVKFNWATICAGSGFAGHDSDRAVGDSSWFVAQVCVALYSAYRLCRAFEAAYMCVYVLDPHTSLASCLQAKYEIEMIVCLQYLMAPEIG